MSTIDENGKPTKLEAETTHETVEVNYVMANMIGYVDSSTNSKPCGVLDKSPSKVRLYWKLMLLYILAILKIC